MPKDYFGATPKDPTPRNRFRKQMKKVNSKKKLKQLRTLSRNRKK